MLKKIQWFVITLLISTFIRAQLPSDILPENKKITTGAERTDQYFSMIKGKKVAVVANHTSLIGMVHLIDSLIHAGIQVVKIFSPEHGLRGIEDAGADIQNSVDAKTGLQVISLYGKNFKIKPKELKDVDIVIFDLQDVGVRFFTYISTLHYVMEACAENNKPLIVLDRPNPNGFYVDGPVLEDKFRSFVGMDPIPIVYGMTIGEYAGMVNGEKWLNTRSKCDLHVVPIDNYNHTDRYILPVKPSPNLPNMSAVYLYPSLCFFEGTVISMGRGTSKPFQVFGHPDLQKTGFSFTPESVQGACLTPPYQGVLCNGYDISDFGFNVISCTDRIYLYWLVGTYKLFPEKEKYFNAYFDKLAGTSGLREQIIKGMSEDNIYKSWQEGVKKFKLIRKKYLLYTDFE